MVLVIRALKPALGLAWGSYLQEAAYNILAENKHVKEEGERGLILVSLEEGDLLEI